MPWTRLYRRRRVQLPPFAQVMFIWVGVVMAALLIADLLQSMMGLVTK